MNWNFWKLTIPLMLIWSTHIFAYSLVGLSATHLQKVKELFQSWSTFKLKLINFQTTSCKTFTTILKQNLLKHQLKLHISKHSRKDSRWIELCNSTITGLNPQCAGWKHLSINVSSRSVSTIKQMSLVKYCYWILISRGMK